MEEYVVRDDKAFYSFAGFKLFCGVFLEQTTELE